MSRNADVMVLYGGTFDPFHIGHEAICHAILAERLVSQLRILPCRTPALKAAASACGFDRQAMIQAWCDVQPANQRIVVDHRELQRKGKSYTIDTVKELVQVYPETKLIFALGADALETLPKWRQVSELVELTSFWVFGRNNEPANAGRLGLVSVESSAQLFNEAAGSVLFDTKIIPAASSSEIRKTKNFDTWPVPRAVRQYIHEHTLYT